MNGTYSVAVIGGACAGSEIASQLAQLGMNVVVFEQNELPYGKIEDGLPRWHEKLQRKEMKAIDERLSHANLHFVPKTKFGADLPVESLVSEWGFSMVVMANGAWRDRPLRVAGIEEVRDDSFVYQNPLVFWFNHYHEKNYNGKIYHIKPATAIIGGGLASIDVAKICMFEMVREALVQRGHEISMVEMDHRGIDHALDRFGLSREAINLKPARLFYRKRVRDMPLVPLPENADETRLKKAEVVREKIIANACKKFGFEVFPLHRPSMVHTEKGSVKKISFEKMEFSQGRFQTTGEATTVDAEMIISSIGSIPEPVPGIPMDGELYRWENRFTGAVAGLPAFYCVGNAITGRGNIKDSAKNARRLGQVIADGLSDQETDYEKWFLVQRDLARIHVEEMVNFLKKMPRTPAEGQANLKRKLNDRWQAVGYSGDYPAWREAALANR